MNISITAEKVTISLSEGAPAFIPGVISKITAQPADQLEWSKTLLEGELVTEEAALKAIKELGPEWRMPTLHEQLSLVDYTRYEPAIDTEKHPDAKSSRYWTSTPCAWNKDAARWVVNFLDGIVGGDLQGNYACVRAVRASQ